MIDNRNRKLTAVILRYVTSYRIRLIHPLTCGCINLIGSLTVQINSADYLHIHINSKTLAVSSGSIVTPDEHLMGDTDHD